jgi:hypothetical protein
MNSNDWKNLLKTVAPTIASVWTGNPLAGIAVSKVSDALFGKPDAKEDEIIAAVTSGNTEVLLKLKQAEEAFLVDMEKLGIERDHIAAGDRDSARNREIQIKDNVPFKLAVGLTVMVGLMTLGLFFVDIPSGNEAIVYLVAGAMLTAWAGAMAYFFGTTSSSNQKNAIMEKMIK